MLEFPRPASNLNADIIKKITINSYCRPNTKKIKKFKAGVYHLQQMLQNLLKINLPNDYHQTASSYHTDQLLVYMR